MLFWEVILSIALFLVIFSVIQVLGSRYMLSKNIAPTLFGRILVIAEWKFAIALAVICICSLILDYPPLFQIFLGLILGSVAWYMRKKYLPK